MGEKKLDKLLALETLKSEISQNCFDSLLNELGFTQEEFDRRMKGIYKEYDFILALHMLDICKSITLIDETYSSVFDVYSSDVLVSLKNGKKFLIEIKSTDDKRYSISMGNLNNRINYAKENNLELYFAISIVGGFWMLFESSYLLKNNGKIKIDDFHYTKLREILNVKSYAFSNYEFVSIFSTKHDKHVIEGYNFEPYGELSSEEFRYNGKRVYKIKNREKDKDDFVKTFMFEALKDRAANQSQNIEQLGSGLTKITETGTEQCISELEFLLSPINHLYGNKKSSAKNYLDHLKDTNKKIEYDIHLIRKLLSTLNPLPIEIYTENDINAKKSH